MKKTMLYLSVLLIITLFCIGCTNQEDKRTSAKSILLPVISLESTEQEIYPAFYEKGFDYKYDNLPTITLSESKDVMKINLSDNFGSSIELAEDYYKYTDHTANIEKETYKLTKNDDNLVSLPLSRRGNVKNEEAIYFLRNDEGTFVFKVKLPLDINN